MGLIGQENSVAECEKLGVELRAIGADQDRTLANCRMAARWLKQSAAMLAEDDPSERRWPARSRPAPNKCCKPGSVLPIPGGPTCSHVLPAGGFRGVGCSSYWHVRSSPRGAAPYSRRERRGAENLFGNASFEEGRDLWQMDLGGKTAGQFTVDGKDAVPANGARC